MASAVLPRKNETSRQCPKKPASDNPRITIFNPKLCPNLVHKLTPAVGTCDFPSKSRHRQSDCSSPETVPPADLSICDLNATVSNVRFCSRYVTFKLSAHSKGELMARWMSELGRVRNLRNYMEARYCSKYKRRAIKRPPSLPLHPESHGAVAVDLEQNETKKGISSSLSSKSPAGKEAKVLDQKHVAVAFSSGRDLNQAAAAASDLQIERLVKSMMKKCGAMLVKLMMHKYGWVFNKPVDVVRLGLFNYNTIIKQPMDLGTVKSKLDKNEYGSPLEFASDVRLTFNNAMIYNLKGQDVHNMAELLLQLFEQMFSPAHHKYKAERERILAASAEEVNRKILAPLVPVVRPKSVPYPMMMANSSSSSTSSSSSSDWESYSGSYSDEERGQSP